MSREGDKTKQPPECEPRFIPFGPDNPRRPGDPGEGRWTQCPNLYEAYGGFEGERWKCDVCGKSYWLDYEEMK